jgi:hypothetical protein
LKIRMVTKSNSFNLNGYMALSYFHYGLAVYTHLLYRNEILKVC